jgi:predicted ABC-type exoprotein transport system permease subunit
MKQLFYNLLLFVAIVCFVSLMTWYIVWLNKNQPPWLEQTLMIMIDPALPMAKDLTDSAAGR